VDLPGFADGTDYARFRAKAQAFLRAQQDHVAIRKLRMNRPLTATDLAELERMLVESGVGAEEDVRRAAAESNGLGLFVRSLVGMDRGAAKDALADFLSRKTLAANQIEFVNLVVDHLTEHGVMDAARLYESPFTDLTPRGPDGLFTSAEVDGLVEAIARIRETALAA
jgi:type I restriction enzyme R subunit